MSTKIENNFLVLLFLFSIKFLLKNLKQLSCFGVLFFHNISPPKSSNFPPSKFFSCPSQNFLPDLPWYFLIASHKLYFEIIKESPSGTHIQFRKKVFLHHMKKIHSPLFLKRPQLHLILQLSLPFLHLSSL